MVIGTSACVRVCVVLESYSGFQLLEEIRISFVFVRVYYYTTSQEETLIVYFLDFFGNKTEWMFGKTPPDAIVTVPNNLDNSSSFLMANWMCLGTILDFLLSLEAFPASSRTTAAKYSNTAAK